MRWLVCFAIATLCVACSEAETPNAGFDAGVRPGVDAGDGQGERDQPCFQDNTCANTTVVCVNDNDGVPKCRLLCDPNNDACGAGQVCTSLADAGDSVCAPTS